MDFWTIQTMKLDTENYVWQLACINRRTYEKKLQMIFVIFVSYFPIYMIKINNTLGIRKGKRQS